MSSFAIIRCDVQHICLSVWIRLCVKNDKFWKFYGKLNAKKDKKWRANRLIHASVPNRHRQIAQQYNATLLTLRRITTVFRLIYGNRIKSDSDSFDYERTEIDALSKGRENCVQHLHTNVRRNPCEEEV